MGEYRRRMKKAAMERYAMKRMRRKFKALQKDMEGGEVDWRTLYNENKVKENKRKTRKKDKADKSKDKRDAEKRKNRSRRSLRLEKTSKINKKEKRRSQKHRPQK